MTFLEKSEHLAVLGMKEELLKEKLDHRLIDRLFNYYTTEILAESSD